MSLDSLFKQNKHDSSQDSAEDEISDVFRTRAEREGQSHNEQVELNKQVRRPSTARKKNSDAAALPEKKRARRRLIGAVALVLAAVIGLPMLFDAEPPTRQAHIAIEIPSKEGGDRLIAKAPTPIQDAPATQNALPPSPSLIDAEKAISANEEVLSPSNLETKKTEAVDTKLPAKSNEPSVNVAKVAAPNTIAAQSKSPAESAKSSVLKTDKAESKTSDNAALKPKEKRDEEARALALLEGREPPTNENGAKPNKSAQFTIQVGAFNSSTKVKEVQQSLKSAQIASYTQKVVTKTGEVTRVRVGPYASKAEAEKVRLKLVKLGHNASVIPQ